MRRASVLIVLLVFTISLRAQPTPHRGGITSPKEAFGFAIGDDYQLATYKQIEAYWKTLDRESDRLVLHDMGKTAEGRTQWMAVVTSPENHRRLARYKDIAKRLPPGPGGRDGQAAPRAEGGEGGAWGDGGVGAARARGAGRRPA